MAEVGRQAGREGIALARLHASGLDSRALLRAGAPASIFSFSPFDCFPVQHPCLCMLTSGFVISILLVLPAFGICIFTFPF